MKETNYNKLINELVSGQLTYRQKLTLFVLSKALLWGYGRIRETDHPLIEKFKVWSKNDRRLL